jgi:hypothetical protein
MGSRRTHEVLLFAYSPVAGTEDARAAPALKRMMSHTQGIAPWATVIGWPTFSLST